MREKVNYPTNEKHLFLLKGCSALKIIFILVLTMAETPVVCLKQVEM